MAEQLMQISGRGMAKLESRKIPMTKFEAII
jgi:hypothetical protein